jgi:type IV secretory pathway protease TraF
VTGRSAARADGEHHTAGSTVAGGGAQGACSLCAALRQQAAPHAECRLCPSAQRPAVAAERLAQLNADSAACIARWLITVAHSEELGRYLVSATGVPAGETVMVLPPNLIQAFDEVRDYNTVIQARQRVRLHLRARRSSRRVLAAVPGAVQRAPGGAAVQRQPDGGGP